MPMPVPRCSLRSSPSLPPPVRARFSCIRPRAPAARARKRHASRSGGRAGSIQATKYLQASTEDRDHHQRNHHATTLRTALTGVDSQRPTAATEPHQPNHVRNWTEKIVEDRLKKTTSLSLGVSLQTACWAQPDRDILYSKPSDI